MIAKVYNTQTDVMLAICDSSLKGKELKSGDLTVEISDFYGDSEVSTEELLQLVQKATIVNAIGKEVISFLISKGVVKKDNVMLFGKVPHVQIFKIK